MNAAVRANALTTEGAIESPRKAFLIAVAGGWVMGFAIIGFSLLVLTIFFIFQDAAPLIGFGFGDSLAALFAQIGGGIFTKAADVGADLVGKVEKNIPEDDPRNPAVIADLVGDNVGDCAGRGSHLFQTFSDDIITGQLVALAAIALGNMVPCDFLSAPTPISWPSVITIGVFSLRLMKRLKPEPGLMPVCW